MTNVTNAPVATPFHVVSSECIQLTKYSLFLRGATASSIVNKPKKISPKLNKTVPTSLYTLLLPITINTKPAAIGSAAYSATFNAKIWLDIVVPILAPITTPIAWRKVIARAFTSAILIIITAEDESRRMVTNKPVSIPVITLLVNLSITLVILSPVSSFNASDNLFRA